MPAKKHEKIRTISTSVNGNRFAVAEWEKNVQVWDINNGLVSKFTTNLASGIMDAISIAEDGTQIAIADYDNKTVTLYDAGTGEILWQKNDIKKPVEAIILNYYPDHIYISTENQGAFFLNRQTGETVEKLKGTESIRENPYSAIDLLEKSTASTLIDRADRKTIKSFPHKSFALLDACFSKDKIVCSYSTNPLEAISLTSFETLWSTNVTGHFLNVEYAVELNKILGIRWDYEKGGPKFLSYIDIETGKVEKEINLGEPIETEFLKQGAFILTSQGKLYSTSTGQQIKEFDFESE